MSITIVLRRNLILMTNLLFLLVDVQENCKDSLEIVDEYNSKILYRGCSELSRPLQVKSISNSVEVCHSKSTLEYRISIRLMLILFDYSILDYTQNSIKDDLS